MARSLLTLSAMGLLFGGDREDTSRRYHVALAAAVIWLGYQGFLNLHRYNAVESNLHSLGQELNIGGEREFRESLIAILNMNSVTVAPDEVSVTLDQAANAYMISVPCVWSVDLFVWRWERKTQHRTRVARTEALRF